MTLQSINWSEITFKSLNLKEAMATSIGIQWRHGATIMTKCWTFSLLDERLRRYLAFYILLINTCKKNTPYPLFKKIMEIRGGKKNYS